MENATSVQALFQTASKQGVSVEALLNAVLAQLDALLNEYAQNGFASCVGEYDAANRDTGRPVLLLQEGRIVHEGVVKGVDAQGALRLLTDNGEKTIVSGEISLRPDNRPAQPAATKPGTLFAAGRRQQSVEMGVGREPAHFPKLAARRIVSLAQLAKNGCNLPMMM